MLSDLIRPFPLSKKLISINSGLMGRYAKFTNLQQIHENDEETSQEEEKEQCSSSSFIDSSDEKTIL